MDNHDSKVKVLAKARNILPCFTVKESVWGVTIGNWLLSVCSTKAFFLILVNVVVLLLGIFVDTSVIQLIMIPILWPVAQRRGI